MKKYIIYYFSVENFSLLCLKRGRLVEKNVEFLWINMWKNMLKISVEKIGNFSTGFSTEFPMFSTSFPQVFHKFND